MTLPLDDFVIQTLARPRRILEVGAGDGQLAAALRRAGFDVLASDPAITGMEAVRPIAIEDLDPPHGSFTAVVANRSLHHVHHLGAALDRIVEVLDRDGLVIVQGFAWDRVDDATGRWLHRESRRLGLLEANVPLEPWLRRWRDDHRGLATFSQLLELELCQNTLLVPRPTILVVPD